MKTPAVFTAAALLAVATGVLFAQVPAPLPSPGSAVGTPLPITAAIPVPPPEPTVDQLLDALEKVKAEQAALAKKEQELLAAVRAKLTKQSERMNKLGVTPTEQPKLADTPKPPVEESRSGGVAPLPPAVSR